MGTQLHLLAHPHATPNRLESVIGLGLKTAAAELMYGGHGHGVSDRPRLCTPPPLGPTPRERNRQDLHETVSMWSRISSVSRRGVTRGITSSSRGRLIRQPTSLARDRWIQTEIEKLHLNAETLHLRTASTRIL
jgi:hypothetical protein